MNNKLVHSALFGVAIGDALGVPVEFESRSELEENPVTGMQGYGTHEQPPGTWSDDTSLTFCLAEVLCKGYDIHRLAKNFISWYKYGHWTPYGRVFDKGIATSKAIRRLMQGVDPIIAGGNTEMDNGNGSLMRILPLLFYIKDMDIEDRYKHIHDVSSLTHGHIRSVLACFIYIEFAAELLKTKDKYIAFERMRNTVNNFLDSNAICSDSEINIFNPILLNNTPDNEAKPIYTYMKEEIDSSGYVVHSLEASLWCLFNTNSFEEAVLSAVNLGRDTDTTGAITGGLAGILYGFESIPLAWIDVLARKDDILELCDKLENKYK